MTSLCLQVSDEFLSVVLAYGWNGCKEYLRVSRRSNRKSSDWKLVFHLGDFNTLINR